VSGGGSKKEKGPKDQNPESSQLGPGHTGLVKSFGQVIWLPLEIYFLYEEDALGIQDSKTPFNFWNPECDKKQACCWDPRVVGNNR
jgi:hypothetical protein